MHTKKIRVGIIGTGAIAEQHLAVLNSFEDVVVAAVANRHSEPRERAQKKFGIPSGYDDFQKMLKEEMLDALFILVSAENILGVTEKSLEAGIPILMEKPPGLSSGETRKLAEKSREHNVPVMVGLNRRFYSIFRKAKEKIEKRGPLLGLVVNVPERIDEARATGKFSPALLEKWIVLNGIHGIDLLRFFGGEVKSLLPIPDSSRKTKEHYGAFLRFLDGGLGHYISHWNSPECWSVELYGNRILARFEPLESGIIVEDGKAPIPIEPDIEDTKFKTGFWGQDRYFIDRVKDKKPIAYPAVSIEDAVKTMELIEKIAG